MDRFLGAHRALYRDFDKFSQDLTGRITDHARTFAKTKQRHAKSANEKAMNTAKGEIERCAELLVNLMLKAHRPRIVI
jgi:hypothetical protein